MIRMILALLLLTVQASGQSTADISQLEVKISKLVSRYDTHASASIVVTYKQTETKLPGVPFTFQSSQLSNSGDPILASMTIEIYTSADSIPPETLRAVKQMANSLFPNPVVSVLKLPQKAAAVAENQESAAATVTEKSQSILERFQDQPAETAMALIILMSVLVGLVVALLFLGKAKAGHKTLQSGLESIASSMATSGSSSTSSQTTSTESTSSRKSSPASATNTLRDTFGHLSDESLLALMLDCYWCEHDTYASYIWKNVPIPRRLALLEAQPLLEDYVSFVSDMEAQEMGFEQDPYYLRPFAIEHIDQSDLTEVVRSYPALLRILPVMRTDTLKLGAAEKIRLLTQIQPEDLREVREQMRDEKLREIASSEKRSLKHSNRLPINSIAEEEEILAMENLSPELKEDILSLAWLAELPDNQITEILDRFSAQELATAWIAPDSILKKLSACLPEKKLRLVDSYKTNYKPSRQSWAFRSIHELAIKAINPVGSDTTSDGQVAA